jgi:hypothetical protein
MVGIRDRKIVFTSLTILCQDITRSIVKRFDRQNTLYIISTLPNTKIFMRELTIGLTLEEPTQSMVL